LSWLGFPSYAAWPSNLAPSSYHSAHDDRVALPRANTFQEKLIRYVTGDAKDGRERLLLDQWREFEGAGFDQH